MSDVNHDLRKRLYGRTLNQVLTDWHRMRAERNGICRSLAETLHAWRAVNGERCDSLTGMQHALHSQLTSAERETLRLVSGGLTNAQIAAARGVTNRSVRNMMEVVTHKLDVTNRTAAALYAWRHGLVSIDESWEIMQQSLSEEGIGS